LLPLAEQAGIRVDDADVRSLAIHVVRIDGEFSLDCRWIEDRGSSGRIMLLHRVNHRWPPLGQSP
jgi:hypothetical protein